MWDTFIEDNMDVFYGRAATRLQTLTEQKKEEYKEVISFLKRGYSVRNTATLANVSVSTVQRVKREFCVQKTLVKLKFIYLYSLTFNSLLLWMILLDGVLQL